MFYFRAPSPARLTAAVAPSGTARLQPLLSGPVLCFHPTEPHTHRQSELLHTDDPHEPPTLMHFQQDLLLASKAA